MKHRLDSNCRLAIFITSKPWFASIAPVFVNFTTYTWQTETYNNMSRRNDAYAWCYFPAFWNFSKTVLYRLVDEPYYEILGKSLGKEGSAVTSRVWKKSLLYVIYAVRTNTGRTSRHTCAAVQTKDTIIFIIHECGSGTGSGVSCSTRTRSSATLVHPACRW